eukprot:11035564-Heterocapsa_arctica.AAC.1
MEARRGLAAVSSERFVGLTGDRDVEHQMRCERRPERERDSDAVHEMGAERDGPALGAVDGVALVGGG